MNPITRDRSASYEGLRRFAAAAPARPRTRPKADAGKVAGFTVALALSLVVAFEGGGYGSVTRAELGIVVWAAIAIGLGLGILPRSQLSGPAWFAIVGFGALTLLTGLAFSSTTSDERTYAELARTLQYGGLVLLGLLALNRNDWQGAAAGLGVAAMTVPIVAVLGRLFPGLISDEVAEALRVDRLSYPLDYWNGVACWGAMAIAAALCWSAHSSRALLRALALASVPFAALSVYLAYSRAGSVAVVLAVLAALALSRNRWTAGANAVVAAGASAAAILVARGQEEIAGGTGGQGGALVLVILGAAALVCAAAAVATFYGGADRLRLSLRRARLGVAGAVVAALIAAAVLHSPLSRGWEQFKSERAIATGSDPTARLSTLGGKRYVAWNVALDAFETDPMRGIGPGTYELFWARDGDDPEFIRDAHSLYLEELAELGLPGLAALLLGLGGLLVAADRARRRRGLRPYAQGGLAALTATYVVFLFYAGVDWMWELGAIGVLGLGSGAIAAAAGHGHPHRRPAASARVACGLGALAMVAAQVPGLSAAERIGAADAALGRGDLIEARELADDAIDAEPWAASPYATRALIAERAGDRGLAEDDIREAIEREPSNWRHRLQLARLEAQAGDRQSAREQLRVMRRLAPSLVAAAPGSPYVIAVERLIRRGER